MCFLLQNKKKTTTKTIYINIKYYEKKNSQNGQTIIFATIFVLKILQRENNARKNLQKILNGNINKILVIKK